MKNFFKKDYFWDILILFIVSLIPLLWFLGNTIVMGHDTGWTLVPLERLIDRFYTWTQTGFGYDQSLEVGSITIYLLPALLSLFKLDLISIQKITYVFWFFMLNFSMYVFVISVYKGSYLRYIAIIAAIFYSVNHYTLQAWTVAELSKFSTMVLFPLSLALAWKTIDGELKLSKAIPLLAILFLVFNAGGGSGLPLMGGMILGFLALFFYKLIIEKIAIRTLVKVYLLFISIFVLINLYWILPLFNVIFYQYSSFAQSGGANTAIEWTNVISQNTSFLNLFRLQGFSSWYDETTHPYAYLFLNNPLLILASYLIPILVFSSLFFAKEKKEKQLIIFFLSLTLLSIFFTAGTHPPTGFIYEWLMKNIYGFAIFRTAFYKFGYLLWFSYAFLFSYASINLISYFKKKYFILTGFILTLVFILIYNFPFFTGIFFDFRKDFTTRIKIPKYITESENYIKDLPGDVRILLVPPPSPINGQTDIYQYGYFSRTPLPYQITQKSVVTNVEINSQGQEELTENFYQSLLSGNEDRAKSLIQILGINYILSRNDVRTNNFLYPILPTKNYSDKITKYDWIKLDREIGEWSFSKIILPTEKFGILPPFANVIYGNYGSALSNLLDKGKENEVIIGQGYETIFPKTSSYTSIGQCINCIDLEKIKTEKPVPRFLPTSPFYFLVKLKEEKNLKNTKQDNFLYSRLLLIYTQKRAYELSLLSKKQESLIGSLVLDEEKKSSFLTSYYFQLEEFKRRYNLLSDEEKIRILKEYSDSINIQISLLEEVENYFPHLLSNVKEEYYHILDLLYILNEDKSFRKTAEINENYYIYSIYIPSDGEYELSVLDNVSSLVFVNGKKYLNHDKVFLQKGDYKVEVPVSSEKFFQNSNSISIENNTYNIQIDKFEPLQRYTLFFEHNIPIGFTVRAEVVDNSGNRFFSSILNGKGIWKKEEFTFNSKSVSQAYKITFVSNIKNMKEEAFIKNIEIAKKFFPNVILTKENSAFNNFSYPRFEVNYKDPTNYFIKIANSQTPFVLLFKESFSSAWEARYKDGEIITKHFSQSNAFNGWYIDKKGNFLIELNFKPQKIYYLGLIATALSLASLVLISLIKILKNK